LTWLYKGKVLEENDIPPKSAGFVYIITNTENGRRYIGRKLMTKSHRRQKDKKIIRSRVDSDWSSYWSSSPEILAEIAEKGTDHLTKEILMFCPMKGQMNYAEEKLQYALGVLESDDWYNGNIRSKIMKKNIKGKVDSDSLNNIVNNLKGNT